MGEKEARTVVIPLRITPSGAAIIDQLRGEWTRTEWVRQAMNRASCNIFRGQVLVVPKLTGPAPLPPKEVLEP